MFECQAQSAALCPKDLIVTCAPEEHNVYSLISPRLCAPAERNVFSSVRLTCRSYGAGKSGNQGYKHFAPLEQQEMMFGKASSEFKL